MSAAYKNTDGRGRDRAKGDNNMNLNRIIAVRNNKTLYRDGDKCIKVFNAEYSKADVLNEALNQARIEEIGLNVPKVLDVTTIDGKWAIVTEYIEGKTLSTLIKENPDKKAEYIELLVDLQMQVHAKRAPLLNRLKDKLDAKIAKTNLFATTRYYLHTRLEEMPKNKKVCHGDFAPSNVIITPDGTAYIVDWAHATQGNASADVAHTYLHFGVIGDTEGAELYLETFCKKSGTDKKYVQDWVPIVAASLSIKGNDSEREYLMAKAQVINYQ